ncbi:hypothetical protein [Calothrix sp. NIES-3974]|nr:hypothetical protein [Calothrix sp. NIES-3974]
MSIKKTCAIADCLIILFFRLLVWVWSLWVSLVLLRGKITDLASYHEL